ncbi:helix-turn-helix transcriptional regulator [Roseburia hominis]
MKLDTIGRNIRMFRRAKKLRQEDLVGKTGLSVNYIGMVERGEKIPSARLVDMSALSEAELDVELEKGYADMKAGRTKSAKKAFADIHKDYNL